MKLIKAVKTQDTVLFASKGKHFVSVKKNRVTNPKHILFIKQLENSVKHTYSLSGRVCNDRIRITISINNNNMFSDSTNFEIVSCV